MPGEPMSVLPVPGVEERRANYSTVDQLFQQAEREGVRGCIWRSHGPAAELRLQEREWLVTD
jgi:hypothetical protein